MDHLCVFLCVSCVLMLLRLFFAALWSPAWKGLTSWLLLVMFIVFLFLSHVVFCVRCGTRLYRSLIYAVFLTFKYQNICRRKQTLNLMRYLIKDVICVKKK